ncbi:hypothetical protein K2173_010809 [Erythroxylum novogranatense]|uniref:Receptor-like serine/threonine-protein kinase n=1 Tax=Erythroxylum novogranatense TaxID=1862640 RepID=A0AAV8T163_9ROSI|nr:hypothetical protein K2173_010809 [Erythroxylum novogranatense]
MIRPYVPYPFCFFLIIHLLPYSSYAYTNISLGSYLIASDDNSSWTSPSGDFAFGFWQVTGRGYLLAIWFNKVPERTIVWSANRNNPVHGGSQVDLTIDGYLILTDQKHTRIWAANYPGTGASYAAMLDTGNLVLAGRDSVNLWQSFDQPTDTILPTQALNLGGALIARLSGTNYSTGRFKFALEADGSLQLSTTKYPFDISNVRYWPVDESSPGSGYKLMFKESGFIYLAARNGSIIRNVSSIGVSTSFYQRAVIDYDGIFVHYVYPKTGSGGRNQSVSWTPLSLVPENICLNIGGFMSSGACGYNSYCRLGDDNRPICQCAPAYILSDPNDVRNGCNRNFPSQKCNTGSQEEDLFELIEMPNTDFPQGDYEAYSSVDEQWCRLTCLNDCYCAAAAFSDGNCYKKTIPLLNGRTHPEIGGKFLIKVSKQNFTTATQNSDSFPEEQGRATLILTRSVLLGCSVLVNALLVIASLIFFLRGNRRQQQLVQTDQVLKASSPRSFAYSELELATGGFQEKLGSGAFGTVYKGTLPCDYDGERLIAVKQLEKLVKSDGDQEFITEVSAIAGTNHRNLVKLLGFCNEGQHRLLVYQYMSNGSLANFLFRDSNPNWYKRIQIAFGIARGLQYLHEECTTQIMHCDIKPQNILLDENLTAKISDFGVSKLLKADQIRTTTAVRGTRGYLAPEWFRSVPVTVKVDVYSYGILLLELICCRRSFLQDAKEESQMVLAEWAYDCYRSGNLHVLVEGDSEALEDMKGVEDLVTLAIWCIQYEPSQRPSMKKVVQMLEGTAKFSAPPDPSPPTDNHFELLDSMSS